VEEVGKGANVTQDQDLAAVARSIVDADRFMALGTADARRDAVGVAGLVRTALGFRFSCSSTRR
jgi:hypothetical protein